MIHISEFSKMPWDWQHSISFIRHLDWSPKQEITAFLKDRGYLWGIDYTIIQYFQEQNTENEAVVTQVFCADESTITLLGLVFK